MNRKPTESKSSKSPSTGKKQATSSTGRRKAKKKPGRPRNREIKNRKALESDIMGILAPGYQPPVPPALSKEEIVSQLTAAKLQNAQQVSSKISPKDIIESHKEAFFENLSEEQQQARDGALRQLVFYRNEEAIDTDVFLKRLLPEKRPAIRRRLLEETIYQISGAFLKYFVAPATGWPKEHLAEVLETFPDRPKDSLIKQSYEVFCDKQVSFENAKFIAPFILAWARLTSSAAFRGSRRAVQKKNAAKAQDDIKGSDGGAPE